MLDPYVVGAELADWEAEVKMRVNGVLAVVDMTSGWTFQVTCAAKGSSTALFTKTTNIAGTTSGATVSWAAASELNVLPAGAVYDLQLRCRRTSDSRDVTVEEQLSILRAIA
jgi:hypothetical protein